jgi:hypothetical protein
VVTKPIQLRLEEAVNNPFAFAERLLKAQRELTLNLVRTLLSDEQPIDPAG